VRVREVIEALSKFDPEMLVVGRGYEGGYDDVSVHVENIVDEQGPNKEAWWDGRYDISEPYTDFENLDKAFDAVVIS
jgi:hypothetical protein